MINPWLNFYTMITGKNLAGQPILGDQTLTRQETLWLATAANKWFIWEDDIGSIEVGNHADLAVLDRDYFTVPDDDIKRIRSVLTVVGGKVVHNDGVLVAHDSLFPGSPMLTTNPGSDGWTGLPMASSAARRVDPMEEVGSRTPDKH